MDDIVAEFLTETNESLGELDNALVSLEQNPNDAALISKIFRFIHTIKGTCGFIGLTRLGKVAHKAEDVLGLFRDKKLEVTPAYVTLILESIDRIKEIITAIETSGSEPEGDDGALIAKLEAVYKGGGAAPPPPAAAPVAETKEKAKESPPAAAAASTTSSSAFTAAAAQKEQPVKEKAETEGEKHAGGGDNALANQTLRVSVEVLENLMTVVSELVLTRNQLLQTAKQTKESEFHSPLQRLNHVVSELQESVMKTRMQPVGNAWSKLPRIVRDVSAELGKKIDLEMRGQETELDRQVLDMIKDPLMHMVRNSADHGIEMPVDRAKAGKGETGKILLNSYHQGGHIIIQISDDGKGLPLEKIKNKIMQNGLATKEQLAAMSAQQIQQYIFHAGFSTADKVTAVSGRGVGMDVVRSNIQKIGGAIEMLSVEGKGTTFTIKIPLTLAIISALIVEVGGARFAIPQLTVSELVMVGEGSSSKIETIDDAPVLRLRENLLPLIYLSDHLKLMEKGKSSADKDAGIHYVVVVNVASFQFGIIVDRVLDMEEIVVKPVSRNLKGLQMFSGNTILGDGNVIMILDPAGVLKMVGMKEHVNNQSEAQDNNLLEDKKKENLLLLFRAGDKTLKAAPLQMVSRLEEIDTAKIEVSNGKRVIQYLGQLMPVFTYDDAPVKKDKVPLIIFRHKGRNAGLVADQILDIAKYYGVFAEAGGGKLLDSVIVGEQATDVVNPEWFTATGAVIQEAG